MFLLDLFNVRKTESEYAVSGCHCLSRYCMEVWMNSFKRDWLCIQEKPMRYPICLQRQEIKYGSWSRTGMSKYEIIDCIMEINKTAKQEFLDQFSLEELDLYLEHLMQVDLEEVALCA